MPKSVPVDVVLVLDVSGSMGSGDNSKLAKMKAAAGVFLDTFLTEDRAGYNSVAAIEYSGSASGVLDGTFVGYSQKGTLKNQINGLESGGGTNIQDGIRQAQELLGNRPEENEKYIVLLSDGAPTYSYKGTAAEAQTWNPSLGSNSNFRLTAFNYGSVYGKGYDMYFSQDGSTSNYRVGTNQVTNHGVPTVSPGLFGEAGRH